MKKTLKIILIILAVIAIITPTLVPLVALVTPPVYSDSFVGALDDKLELLRETEGEKIVVIGGSSVAFGLDSALIESYTGMPVVNFGLYAALGTKLMLDLSLPHINDGDIVILSPELDSQTLSTYFSAATTLRALDGSLFPTLFDIPAEHYASLYGASWDYTAEKLGYLLGEKPTYEGIYNSENFNGYGDIKEGLRPENIMTVYYDPNTEITLDPSILSPDFRDYLNEYVRKCKKKGAEVWFSYAPMNELAISKRADAKAFGEYLEKEIDAKFISYIEDYIIPANYFYDTNFHLNDGGVLLRTIRLIEDILMELGDTKEVVEQIPEAPKLPSVDMYTDVVDKNAEYFEFERLANGSYMITGIKEEYRGVKTLTVPLAYNNFKVTQIGPGAFKNSSLVELVITSDTNVRVIMNGAFEGASSLSALIINYFREAEILPPADFAGVSPSFTVYVPSGSSYASGYYWGERGLDFKYLN